MSVKFELVEIEKPEKVNVIIGTSHFIMTVQDIHEMIIRVNPAIKFGLAFNEASGPCLVRKTGNDSDLIGLAVKNAIKVATGHSFFLFMDEGWPIYILNSLKMVPEVCNVLCATANPLQVIVCSSDQGRGIAGCIDGHAPKGVEKEADIQNRIALLKAIGYKL